MTVQCSKCPLRRQAAFKTLTDDDLSFMESFKMGELRIDAGSPIILEGSNSPHFFTTLSGIGVREKTLPDGRRQITNFVFPGDLIGLQAGLLGEMKHGVEAITEMVFCVFSRERMWELFRSHPERAFDVTWLAATEQRSLSDALLSVGQKNGKEKIASLLLFVMRRAIESGYSKDEAKTAFPFRQQDIAEATGLSIVYTNRMLQELRAEKLIRLQDGHLELLDVDTLADMAMSDHEPDDLGRPLL